MKLRNKKTGEIKNPDFVVIDDWEKDAELARVSGHILIFRSIEQLVEEYEDYEPKEPRINDEDARDAVYSWASSLQIHEVRCTKRAVPGFSTEVTMFEAFRLGSTPIIEFTSLSLDADVADGKTYTIDELCGEEEE